MRTSATCVAVIASALLAGRAHAQAPERPSEALLGMGQFAAGAAAALILPGSLALLSQDESRASDVVSAAVFLATPALVGTTVCLLGQGSPAYESSWGWTITMSYVSTLSVLPLALFGSQLGGALADDDKRDDSPGATTGAVVGIALGWLVVQPLAATLTWHAHKRPRAKSAAAVPPALWARPAGLATPRARRDSRAPGQVVVPMLALSF
jgi:hypothetical protein